MGKTAIRPDGGYNTTVSIKDATGKVTSAAYVLLVDTGADSTVVSYNDAIKGGTWKAGALMTGRGPGDGALTSLQFLNGTMTIETEQQGGGAVMNKTCSKISAAFGKNPFAGIGQGAAGILGMDQMNAIQADPQQNMQGTAARMARRATCPLPILDCSSNAGRELSAKHGVPALALKRHAPSSLEVPRQWTPLPDQCHWLLLR